MTAAPFADSATVAPGAAAAHDNVGVVSVTRAPAGSSFPLGTTTVTWTATDAAGNAAHASQHVTVKRASVHDELAALAALIDSWNLRRPADRRFDHRIAELERALDRGDRRALCAGLVDLARRAVKDAGRELTPAEAAIVVVDAARIAVHAGCSVT